MLPYLKTFKRYFNLVDDAAIALHIGHRHSIDFDLFTYSILNKLRIKSAVAKIPFHKTLLLEDYDQIHYNINEVKVSFFSYPFDIKHKEKLDNTITFPSLFDISGNVAFAL